MAIELDAQIKVTVVEVDGEHAPLGSRVTVRSHAIKAGLVTVEIDGKAMTVVGSDLRAAIQRCERY